MPASAPSAANETSNSARSSGNIDGSASWKKCDMPWASPIEPDDSHIVAERVGASGIQVRRVSRLVKSDADLHYT